MEADTLETGASSRPRGSNLSQLSSRHQDDQGKRRSSNLSQRSKRSFQPAYETFGPMRNAGQVKYKPPSSRQHSRENLASQKGSVANLHCDDTLRRVSVVVHRHILVCERRRLLFMNAALRGDSNSLSESMSDKQRPNRGSIHTENDWFEEEEEEVSMSPTSPSLQSMENLPRQREFRGALDQDLVEEDATELLNEDSYLKSQWKYAFLRLPRLPLWTPYRMERVVRTPEVPTVERIYSFIRHLFVEAELSSECSVVCLVYVERLMERADVELLATNWRPIIMAGMLLASKVWQDLSSWNIEFARIYPQFSLKSINLLERNVLKLLKWDLFISGAVYAKYYFALRSLNESKNFRRRYNYIMRVNAPNSKQLEKRSAAASSSLYSRSM